MTHYQIPYGYATFTVRGHPEDPPGPQGSPNPKMSLTKKCSFFNFSRGHCYDKMLKSLVYHRSFLWGVPWPPPPRTRGRPKLKVVLMKMS